MSYEVGKTFAYPEPSALSAPAQPPVGITAASIHDAVTTLDGRLREIGGRISGHKPEPAEPAAEKGPQSIQDTLRRIEQVIERCHQRLGQIEGAL